MILVIVGESAGGKSSVADYISETYGLEKIVTYTTRPQRAYERNGKDYHFITEEKYEQLSEKGFFAETATYNNWHYASAVDSYKGDKVVVLTPKGLRQIRSKKIPGIFSVYINVPRKDRMIKCLERGDSIEEAYRRNLSDVGQFDGIELEVDLVIDNPEYKRSIRNISETIMGYAH